VCSSTLPATYPRLQPFHHDSGWRQEGTNRWALLRQASQRPAGTQNRDLASCVAQHLLCTCEDLCATPSNTHHTQHTHNTHYSHIHTHHTHHTYTHHAKTHDTHCMHHTTDTYIHKTHIHTLNIHTIHMIHTTHHTHTTHKTT
jgi:hypothetical protein